MTDEKKLITIYFKMRENNPQFANTLLCYAAEHGYCEACKLLGGLHFTGNGVPQSKEKAYVWYRLAEKYNCRDCCATSIDMIREWLSIDELSHAEVQLKNWEPGQCEIELGVSP